jgi:alpha-beta hydrolase superfamily lysophospholipase
MLEDIPAKIFKCQINHEGDRVELNCWFDPELTDIKASILIIHDLGENIESYADAIKKMCDQGYKVYGFNLRGNTPRASLAEEGNTFPSNFRDFTIEILQVIAYIKHIEGGVPPFLLTQGLGSLVGLITTRKHPAFVRGFIACSPMFQLTEKIIPIKRFTIRTMSDFFPDTTLPKKITPKFTSNRKIVKEGDSYKYEARVSSREAYEYLKAMSQARKNFSKISKNTLLICPDHNSVHKYSFLKKAISKHKYEDQIEFVNLHTKYHAIASDRATVLETYEKYIMPWIEKSIAIENKPAKQEDETEILKDKV